MTQTPKTFETLYAELARKVAERAPGSSTVARVDAGVHEIGKKIVEEAAEVWMAAEYQSKDQAAEAAAATGRSSTSRSANVAAARAIAAAA